MFASVINVINVKEGQKKGKRYNDQKKGKGIFIEKNYVMPIHKSNVALIVFLVLFPFNLCLSSRKSMGTIMSKV